MVNAVGLNPTVFATCGFDSRLAYQCQGVGECGRPHSLWTREISSSNLLTLTNLKSWLLRLLARIPGSQLGEDGSIPSGATNRKEGHMIRPEDQEEVKQIRSRMSKIMSGIELNKPSLEGTYTALGQRLVALVAMQQLRRKYR